MSSYTGIVSKCFFPLHERLKGHITNKVYRAMETSQWLSPEELAVTQLEDIKVFLGDIGQHVPYYRDLFATIDFDPSALQSIADLQALPLMGKPEIRAHTERMKAEDAVGLQRFNTGGSSGEPLIFYLGKERISHDVAAKRRATRWWGVDIGDPEIVVWGSPIELGAQDKVRLIRDRIFRTELLSAFEMSEVKLLGFVDRIRRVKPRMLFGYPSSLALIAQFSKEQGYQLCDLGVKVVFVTSERLYEHQRREIETAFACPVANGYGGRDAGFIAHECPSGAMHITAEDMVVEIVDDNGKPVSAGETGEIVVTHMRTRDFPFVRYKTGDIGAIGSMRCSCGRGLPVLTELQGRSTDFVKAMDGTVLHGLALIYVLRDIAEVKSFKIIQESLDTILVQLVVCDGAGRTTLESLIQRQFKQRLGAGVTVNFEYLKEAKPEPSGKHRYVISKLQN